MVIATDYIWGVRYQIQTSDDSQARTETTTTNLA